MNPTDAGAGAGSSGHWDSGLLLLGHLVRLQAAGSQPLATDQLRRKPERSATASSPARPRPWPWRTPRRAAGLPLVSGSGSSPCSGLTRLPTCARQPGVAAEGLTKLSGLVGPKLARYFFPEGPAITAPCGGALNVKANVFLMFLSSQKKTLKWKPADASEAARLPRHRRHRCGRLGHGWGLQEGPSPEIHVNATRAIELEGSQCPPPRRGLERGFGG